MRKQKETVVNGNKYLITQFGGIQGLRLGKSVAKILLPALSSVFSQEEADTGRIMEAVAENLDKLDEDTIVELLSETHKNKQVIDFDSEFAGNYYTLFLLLWEVIEFNFSDLLFQMAPAEETEE